MEKQEKDVYILAVESSCDETAAAVVKNGRWVLSNVISSQTGPVAGWCRRSLPASILRILTA